MDAPGAQSCVEAPSAAVRKETWLPLAGEHTVNISAVGAGGSVFMLSEKKITVICIHRKSMILYRGKNVARVLAPGAWRDVMVTETAG